ncbi:hypothetical protein BD626DRAFT_573981 [Schizophyllum amplum]|uniref:Uncharacterized protein n=1 Tax=Schizophyllum amplum TaxID=97359 RepID=A0A550BZM0_9AGAR|nr:hypothetical protein BD626DRAFT_573981 [Auriculariopsis ampla]
MSASPPSSPTPVGTPAKVYTSLTIEREGVRVRREDLQKKLDRLKAASHGLTRRNASTGLRVETLEDLDVPEPVKTAVRRLERVLTGTSIDVVKAAQQSLQVLADRLRDDGKVDAGVLSAAISLLDKRVTPLLTHINKQRHTIRELMDTVDQSLPLDRELKTREPRRQLKRAEEERDRAQATLLAAGGHIAAARDDAFAHVQAHAAVQEKEALEIRLVNVQGQLNVALEHELARRRRIHSRW